MNRRVRQLEGSLIVSCQASEGEPLCAPEHILALALSAIAGGARGLRLEGVANVAHVRKCEKLSSEIPIIGLTKSQTVAAKDRLKSVYITGTFEEAKALADAGADIIALDATGRPRPDGLTLKQTIERIHSELTKPIWADVSTFAEGIEAFESGVDVVSTTLYGYTEATALPAEHGPGLELLRELVEHVKIPVILEGRVWHPDEVKKAFESGAHAVVVGSAITRPAIITERFVKAIPVKRQLR